MPFELQEGGNFTPHPEGWYDLFLKDVEPASATFLNKKTKQPYEQELIRFLFDGRLSDDPNMEMVEFKLDMTPKFVSGNMESSLYKFLVRALAAPPKDGRPAEMAEVADDQAKWLAANDFDLLLGDGFGAQVKHSEPNAKNQVWANIVIESIYRRQGFPALIDNLPKDGAVPAPVASKEPAAVAVDNQPGADAPPPTDEDYAKDDPFSADQPATA